MSIFTNSVDTALTHIDALRTHIDNARRIAPDVETTSPADGVRQFDVGPKLGGFYNEITAARSEVNAMSGALVGALDLVAPKPRFHTPAIHRQIELAADSSDHVAGMLYGVHDLLVRSDAISDHTMLAANASLEYARSSVDLLDTAVRGLRNEADRGSKYINDAAPGVDIHAAEPGERYVHPVTLDANQKLELLDDELADALARVGSDADDAAPRAPRHVNQVDDLPQHEALSREMQELLAQGGPPVDNIPGQELKM